MQAPPPSLGLNFPSCQMRKLEEAICHIPSGPDLRRRLSWCWGMGRPRTPGGSSDHSPRFRLHRLNLSKSRLLTRAAKGFLSKPLTKVPESTPGSQSFDYIPLVSALDPRP